MTTTRHPMQPLEHDKSGVLRFKENAIVSYLLDTHLSVSMNQLAAMPFSKEDRQQFAQLIGYSLSGYGELTSYVDDEAYAAAEKVAEGMDERDARIAALEEKLAAMREAADKLREHVAVLFEMHPDDLRKEDT